MRGHNTPQVLRPGELIWNLTPPPDTRAANLSKAEAEELLDWLEATGRNQPQLSHRPGRGFIVRWS